MLDVDVRLRRGDALALDVRLAVPPGTVLVVRGPSGAGKTTVLRAIAGLLRPEDGRIACGGTTWFDAAARTDVRPRDRSLGVVPQGSALLPHLSAWRNVAFALAHEPRDRRRAVAVALLERLGVGARADARPAELSGGERSRVALARALARRPVALLLDEPFAALDGDRRDDAARLVREVVAERAVPAVVVSHDPADAERLGGPSVALAGGALRWAAPGRP